MLGPVARISNRVGRSVMINNVRNGSHGGIPGENLPFDIHNKNRLTFHMFWYVGTGMAAPFIVLWHQLVKNNYYGKCEQTLNQTLAPIYRAGPM